MSCLEFVHPLATRWVPNMVHKLSLSVQFLFQANKPAFHKHSLTFCADCKASELQSSHICEAKMPHREMGVAK